MPAFALHQPVPPSPPDWLVHAALVDAPHLIGMPWQSLQGGRVNRVWRVGDRVVKLYDPAGDSPLFPNNPVAEAVSLHHLAGTRIAPQWLAQGLGWIAYRHIDGAAWAGNVRVVAQLLWRLQTLSAPALLPAGWRRLPGGSHALTRQTRAILAQCRSSLPAPPPVSVEPSTQTCVIHGDLVPGNIIISAADPVLIDWQCPAIGDPVEDMAHFLSPAMQFLYRGAVLTPDETATFLAACEPVMSSRYLAMAPLFHWRMAAHCMWKAERGEADYRDAMRLELAALRP